MKISTGIEYALNLDSTPEIKHINFKWDQFTNDGEDFVTISNDERYKISKELRANLELHQNTPLIPIKTKP